MDTYITICAGVKQVLMLPPGKNFFEEMEEEEEGTKKLQFPLRPTEQLLKRIHSAGGYFFKLKTRPQKVRKQEEKIHIISPFTFFFFFELGTFDFICTERMASLASRTE